ISDSIFPTSPVSTTRSNFGDAGMRGRLKLKESQMRPRLAVIALLAVSVVTSVAFAAQDKVNVTFESFSASGVIGTATLDPMPNGEVQIHASIRGLEPGVEYVAL